MIVRRFVSVVTVLVLFCVALIGSLAAQEATPAPAALSELQDLDQFRDLFNQQSGKPSLLLLISPT